MATNDFALMQGQLAAPFDQADIKFKPGAVSGNRAMALAYVTARAVMDRLDAVLGIDGWKDSYEWLPDGAVLCRLSCKIGDAWIQKADVGGASGQPDPGDRCKAAFSDALKRAAVKFGIGRYLYNSPQQWVEYDGQKKRFAQTPTMPTPPATKAKPPEPGKTPAPERAQSDTVSDREAAELCDLIARAGSGPDEFYNRYRVGKVRELPVVHFQAAKVWLSGRVGTAKT